MGIQGLLQFIKDASEPVHIQKYKGQAVAVDTYCWLHKGAFSCAEKLAKGEPTDQYVSFCMKFVDMLLSYSVKPILVFDGRNLPSKQEVEKARRERRQANLQRGKQLLREGKLAEARDCFTRCVNVTPSMAHEVIKAARVRGVDCVVAPYEADAQLAFLNKTGIAQAVITEDSDLLAFGCKKVILKMDKQGHGLEIAQCHLGRCRSLGDVFTEEKFRYMCILSGCDYLASLYGIGLGKACKLLKIANNPDILKVIRKIGQYLKMNITVPDDYLEGFVKANNTFLYQLVFDPVSRKVVPLNPYPENVDPATLGYAGENLGDEQGLQMALGNVDINTMKRIDNFNPDAPTARPLKVPRSRGWGDTPVVSGHASIWSRSYIAGASQPRASPSPQKRARTHGKEAVVPLRGLKLPHREPQVKRPRQDSGISDEDVLDQYGSKRQRAEAPVTNVQRVDEEAGRSQVRARNRFATLLQWRNQSEDGDGGQGTRSRFFASSELSVPEPKEPKPSDKEQSEQTGPAPAVNTEPHADCPTPRRASLGAFGWSGCSSDVSATSPAQSDRPRTPSMPSGLSVLQHFQRKTESRSWGKSDSPRRSAPPSPTGGAVDIATPPGSPPSQDSAYFSQSNREPSFTEDSPPGRLSAESPIEEKDPWRDSGCSGTPSDSSVTEEGRAPPLRTKVSGLSRTRPGEHGTKIRPSAPARASGLRKKPQGKKAAVSNENNPGMQATISSLWKNFSFNKQNPRLNAAKKADAASPVSVLR